jgi:hypothetical protein
MDTAGATMLFTVPVLHTGNSTNSLRIRITRDSEGNWDFYGDPAGGLSMDLLGSVTLPDSLPGHRFGLYCEFTSSNSTKFYFDDIYCGPQIVDTTGPVLLTARVMDPARILLQFDEAVDEASANDAGNYWLSGEIGVPYEAFRMLDPVQVMLFFEDNMAEGVDHQLNVENITDLAGNMMSPAEVTLSWYDPKPYDVIINEILADPSPPVLLPAYEYIELYNRCATPIDLEGWELSVSGDDHLIAGTHIEPRGYLLIMEEEALPEFKFCGPALGLSSFSIPNDGTVIILRDSTGRVICHTVYDPEKYAGSEKAQGGWSLERTDPWYPCDDENSWQASSGEAGGTPGSENSLLISTGELPAMETLCCLTDSSLLIRFSHAMSYSSLTDPLKFYADQSLGNPLSADLSGESAREAVLTFGASFIPGTIYELQASGELEDCTGIPLEFSMKGLFSLPAECEPFDIIFNEVLFHPLNDGAEYIELYNRSSKTVHLDRLFLAYVRENPPNPPDTDTYTISDHCKPFLPGEYILLTRYPEKVSAFFHVEDERSVFRTSPFPTLNNGSGKVLLTGDSGTIIDVLEYSEDMHYPLLGSFTGVSLERICTEIQCTGPGYWHSASSSSGFGTPGYMNSQYQSVQGSENTLEIEPLAFSPDGDGRDDILGIHCHFDEPGMLISITIFTEEGRLARALVNTALAGNENIFYWDGLTDSHFCATPGIYIILLETVSMNGYSRKHKKVAILLP